MRERWVLRKRLAIDFTAGKKTELCCMMLNPIRSFTMYRM
jgi:hypothetical protein